MAHGAAGLADWLNRLEVLHPKKIDLSLERVRAVLATLGLDRPPYRVVSVGGTNGKGSCVATLDAIYRSAGYRVGAYTSPHLFRFNERICFDGAEATDAELVSLFEYIDRARGATTLSYFEYATVAACLYFAQRQAEVAVLEIGLGGRLDAVNALDADVALIASIDLDHQHWLGDTREAIGFEKAGIMRAGNPAILGDRNPPATVLEHAAAVGADLWRAGRDFELIRHPDGSWDYHGRNLAHMCLPAPVLHGDIQYDNAASCLAAVESMQHLVPVDLELAATALERVRLQGRLQRMSVRQAEWVFDVAHNPAAMQLLARELERRPVRGRTLAIVGLMADKDIRGVLAPLSGLVHEWLVTRADSPRAAPEQMLVAALEAVGCRAVRQAADTERASADALEWAQPGDRVLVFGSFQIVGPVMSALKLYFAASSSGDISAKWTGV